MKKDANGSAALQWFKQRYGEIAFHPMDFTVIGYLLFLGILIIPFHNDVRLWGLYPIVHLIVVVLLLEFLRIDSLASHDNPGGLDAYRFYKKLLESIS